MGFLVFQPVKNTLLGQCVPHFLGCVYLFTPFGVCALSVVAVHTFWGACLKCSSYPMGFSPVFSLCQELHPDEIDTDSAYILFYEQQGVDYAQFLPKIDGKKMADTSSMDEDFESDYKKYCVLQ